MKKVIHPSGATRHDDIGEARYDLISTHALESLARVYGHGASRHGDRNWEQGLPYGDTYNRVQRHLNRAHMKMLGMIPEDGEDDIGHAFWGIAAIIHFKATGYYKQLKQEEGDDCKGHKEREKGSTTEAED